MKTQREATLRLALTLSNDAWGSFQSALSPRVIDNIINVHVAKANYQTVSITGKKTVCTEHPPRTSTLTDSRHLLRQFL